VIGSGRRARWRTVVWTLLLVMTAAVRAQSPPCLPMAGGGELTVAGIGRIVFAALATDRARDAASLTGGVCITFAAIDGVLRTERLELSGLTGRIEVEAVLVTLQLPGWALTARELRSDGTEATLVGVTMLGTEAVGLADEVVFDLVTGRVVASALRLATDTVWMDAAHATFDGQHVWATDALLTTCDCPPEEAAVRLQARSAQLQLVGSRLRMEAASLSLGGVNVPLPDPFELDAEGVAAFRLPVSIGADPDGVRGLLVRGLEREVAPGARFAWDVGSGEGARPPDVGVHVEAAGDGAWAALTGGSEGLRVTWRSQRSLGGGLGVTVAQRLETGAFRDAVRDQGVTLDWAARLERPAAAWSRLDLAGSAQASLSAQRLGPEEVVGPRFGVEARLRAVGDELAHGRPGLELAAGATHYPAQATGQAWVALTPSWMARSGPWLIEVSHLARWVAGASPFGVSLDRRVPMQRTDLVLTVSAPGADGWRLAASSTLRLDWRDDPLRPNRLLGLERLRVRFEAEGPAWGGRLEIAASGELAGWVDPRPQRTAETSISAAWTRRQLEFGARAVVELDGARTVWNRGVVFAAWPVTYGDATWRPYLAFDIAAVGRGGAGWWSGHGLELAWTTCCGIVEFGYRHDDGLGTRLHAALRFETHTLEVDRLDAAADAAQGRVPAPVTTP
jgi:hypothetical protein